MSVAKKEKHILWKARAHWIYYIDKYSIILLGIGSLLFLSSYLNQFFLPGLDILNKIITVLIIGALGYMVWLIMLTFFESYEITNSELIITSGIVVRKKSFLNLNRIRDIEINQPVLFTIISSRANIIIFAPSDASNFRSELKAIKNWQKVENLLNQIIDKMASNATQLMEG